MELNSTVIYTENGKEYTATVLEIRYLDHHQGENGEPLLHLGYFAPVLDAEGKPKKLIGTQDQNSLVQFRIDVAHESHEFSPEAGRKGLKGTYPGGRWREIEPSTQPAMADSTGDSTIQ